MKRFTVSAMVTVSAYTHVWAECAEDALRIAASRQVVVGGDRSGNSSDEEFIIEEADGEPSDLSIVE